MLILFKWIKLTLGWLQVQGCIAKARYIQAIVPTIYSFNILALSINAKTIKNDGFKFYMPL